MKNSKNLNKIKTYENLVKNENSDSDLDSKRIMYIINKGEKNKKSKNKFYNVFYRRRKY